MCEKLHGLTTILLCSMVDELSLYCLRSFPPTLATWCILEMTALLNRGKEEEGPHMQANKRGENLHSLPPSLVRCLRINGPLSSGSLGAYLMRWWWCHIWRANIRQRRKNRGFLAYFKEDLRGRIIRRKQIAVLYASKMTRTAACPVRAVFNSKIFFIKVS